MDKTDETEDKGQRVTVEFNAEDMSRIRAEETRRTAERGYTVHRADILRELVRSAWPVPPQ